jgi:hypothetical protein
MVNLMKIILDHETCQIIQNDSGIYELIDKLGLIKRSMLYGPMSSVSGDNIRTTMNLPKVDKSNFSNRIQISFWLNRNLPINGRVSGNNEINGGDSLAKINNIIVLKQQIGNYEFEVICVNNRDGRLCGLIGQFKAGNAKELEKMFYAVANKILSVISFQNRIPLFADKVEIFNFSSEMTVYEVVNFKSFYITDSDITNLVSIPQLLQKDSAWHRALTYYRESLLLAGLPMYRFLALYKGIEDLKRVRGNISKECLSKNIKIKFSKSLYPKEGSLIVQYFPDLVEQPVAQGLKLLKSRYRHYVAHNLLDDGSFMTSDYREGTVDYNNLCTLADVTFMLMSKENIDAAERLEN